MLIRPTLLLVAIALMPEAGRAQAVSKRETLKQAPTAAPSRAACPPVPTPNQPTDAQRRQARELTQRGLQAAIHGDRPSALNALRDASALDRTDPDLAYQLARAYETASDGESAAKAYCSFLALSPTGPEAAEAREKARTLAPRATSSVLDSATAAFREGIAAYNRGQSTAAEVAFTTALRLDSAWADAVYNRAIVRLARDDRRLARSDFEQYLRLKPEADDRASVVARVDALRGETRSSAAALTLGLVLPGGGQFYTGRPMRGLLSMAGVAAAIGLGLREKSTTTPVERTGIDPFGNSYTFMTTRVTMTRPYLVPGMAAAGAIALGAAVDAFMYARKSSDDSRGVALSFAPSTNGLVAQVTLLTR